MLARGGPRRVPGVGRGVGEDATSIALLGGCLAEEVEHGKQLLAGASAEGDFESTFKPKDTDMAAMACKL